MSSVSAIIYKATSDDQNAIGGFLLKELADKTFASAKDCTHVASALVKRLQKESPDIKWKVLRTIKYLCENGADGFRAEFQRDNEAIRQCTHYKGPPDPLRGDAPSQRVRDAAKETMTSVFNAPTSKPATHTRFEGYGGDPNDTPVPESSSSFSSSSSGGGGGGGGGVESRPTWNGDPANAPPISSGLYSSGTMVGFGSHPNVKEEPGILERFKNKLTGQTNEVQRPTASSFRPPSEYSNSFTNPAPAPAQFQTEDGHRRERGKVGGNWGGGRPTQLNGSNGTVGGGGGGGGGGYRDSYSHDQQNSGGGGGSGGGAGGGGDKAERKYQSNGEFETRLVDEITEPSGVRLAPRPEELQSFLKKCESLDLHLVSGILDQKLVSGALASKVKSLHVILAILKTNSEDAEDYFLDHPAQLRELETSDNANLRAKSSEILVRLGMKDASAIQKPAAAAAPMSGGGGVPKQEINLFDVQETPVSNGTGAHSVQPPTQMFSQMQVSSTPAVTAPQVEAAKPKSGGGLFDLDSFEFKEVPAEAMIPTTSSVPSTSATIPVQEVPKPSTASNDRLKQLLANAPTAATPSPFAFTQTPSPFPSQPSFPAQSAFPGYPPANAMAPMGMGMGGYPGAQPGMMGFTGAGGAGGFYPQQQAQQFPMMAGPGGFPAMGGMGGGFPAVNGGYRPAGPTATGAARPAGAVNFTVTASAASTANSRKSIELGPSTAAPPSGGFSFVDTKSDSFSFVSDLMK